MLLFVQSCAWVSCATTVCIQNSLYPKCYCISIWGTLSNNPKNLRITTIPVSDTLPAFPPKSIVSSSTHISYPSLPRVPQLRPRPVFNIVLPTMQWSEGVAQAIVKSKADNSPLLVLVEPPTSVLHPASTSDESPAHLHDRVATRSLHNILFTNPSVLHLVREAHLNCLRISADPTSLDFQSFSNFFTVTSRPPNLFLIAPGTGLVLYRLPGYVSPSAFMHVARNAVLAVCKKLPPSLEVNATPNLHTSQSTVTSPAKPSASITDSANATPAPAPAPAPGPAPAPKPVAAPVPSASKSLKLPTPPALEQTRLRARLPDGRNVERILAASSPFSQVRSWLCDEAGLTPAAATIATSYPRRVFDAGVDADSLLSLNLAPSANLIITQSSTPGSSAPREMPRVVAAASSAVAVVGAFLRSFVVAPPEHGEDAGADTGGIGGGGNGGNNNAQTPAGTQGGPQALRMTEDRRRRDANLMSNGNSTQFGWNPSDFDEEQNQR